MKKIVFLVLLLALVLVLFISCTDKNEDSPDAPANINNNTGDNAANTPPKEMIMQDWYFFRTYITEDHSLQYVKINPVSLTVTNVCIDPLCDHGKSGCPLDWGLPTGAFTPEKIHVSDNYIFYTSAVDMRASATQSFLLENLREIRAYDILNGGVQKLADSWENIHMNLIGAAEGRLYYFFPQVNEEDDTLVDYVVYRGDARTGENIQITEPLSYQPNIFDIIDGKIYWDSRYEQNYIYTTDLEGKNKETVDLGSAADYLLDAIYSGGYLYYTVHNGAEIDSRLYKIPLGGGKETQLLAGSVIDFVVSDSRIYLTMLEDEPELIEYGGAETYNWSGGKIWSINLDGTDMRLVADTGYNLSRRRLEIWPGAFVGVKTINDVDYIAWSFRVPEEVNFNNRVQYIFSPSSDTIIINGSTGEWIVLEMPE
jgi:hypothetical protein